MKISFPGLLALLFITLKLTGYIAWTWFWVLSPLWITFLFGVTVLIVIFVAAFLSERNMTPTGRLLRDYQARFKK